VSARSSTAGPRRGVRPEGGQARCAVGSGRPASKSGTLCHGDRARDAATASEASRCYPLGRRRASTTQLRFSNVYEKLSRSGILLCPNPDSRGLRVERFSKARNQGSEHVGMSRNHVRADSWCIARTRFPIEHIESFTHAVL